MFLELVVLYCKTATFLCYFRKKCRRQSRFKYVVYSIFTPLGDAYLFEVCRGL